MISTANTQAVSLFDNVEKRADDANQSIQSQADKLNEAASDTSEKAEEALKNTSEEIPKQTENFVLGVLKWFWRIFSMIFVEYFKIIGPFILLPIAILILLKRFVLKRFV